MTAAFQAASPGSNPGRRTTPNFLSYSSPILLMVKKKRRASVRPRWQREIARERIQILFRLAEEEFSNDRKDLANRYVELARKISTRCNVRIPRELKRRFCRKCLAYLKPGVNARVRIRSEKKYVLVTCLECGNKMRYPYIREKRKN